MARRALHPHPLDAQPGEPHLLPPAAGGLRAASNPGSSAGGVAASSANFSH